jgi:hypothetical protein
VHDGQKQRYAGYPVHIIISDDTDLRIGADMIVKQFLDPSMFIIRNGSATFDSFGKMNLAASVSFVMPLFTMTVATTLPIPNRLDIFFTRCSSTSANRHRNFFCSIKLNIYYNFCGMIPLGGCSSVAMFSRLPLCHRNNMGDATKMDENVPVEMPIINM